MSIMRRGKEKIVSLKSIFVTIILIVLGGIVLNLFIFMRACEVASDEQNREQVGRGIGNFVRDVKEGMEDEEETKLTPKRK